MVPKKMIRRILVDQELCEKENISINAAIIFDVIIKLMTHSQIEKTTHDNKVYTVMYRNMILLQVKYFKISTRTLTKALTELENADLIDCINKNTVPAYITTQKADKYKFLPKVGEFDFAMNTPQKKKPQLFSLAKKTRLDKTTDDYKKLLRIKCEEYSIKENIEYKATFETFADYHISKGTAFVNWFSAYRNWCKTQKRFNKPKDTGMYQ